jgi:hypothetical protein
MSIVRSCYRRKMRISMLSKIVPKMLTSNMVAKGKYIFKFSLSNRKSPGKFPSQGKYLTATRITNPAKAMANPIMTSKRPNSTIIKKL